MKRTTDWRKYEHGIIRAEYGWEYLHGNLLPYFSITATTCRRERVPGERSHTFRGKRYWEEGGGCMHEEIAEAFPELKDLIPWHLADTNGLPMHYAANARYWAAIALGQKTAPDYLRKEPIEILKEHMLWGSIPADQRFMDDSDAENATRVLEPGFLESREGELQTAMLETIQKHGLNGNMNAALDRALLNRVVREVKAK